MRSAQLAQLALISSLVAGAAVPATAAAHARRGSAASRSLAKRTVKPRVQSQRTIDDERATQLQAALIKSGYLTGQPSGHWDAQSEAAMAKLQADNGWQTKLVPDSRAIIKLGLGPSTASLPAQSSAPPLSQPGTISQQ
jgi:hypothetical protein